MTDSEQFVRDVLTCCTSLIPDEKVAGYVFGVGLVVTDHLFGLARFSRRVLGGG